MKWRITLTQRDGRTAHFRYATETTARALLDFLDSRDGATAELQERQPCREPGCPGHWKTHTARDLTARAEVRPF
jgi:hypothetical protein